MFNKTMIKAIKDLFRGIKAGANEYKEALHQAEGSSNEEASAKTTTTFLEPLLVLLLFSGFIIGAIAFNLQMDIRYGKDASISLPSRGVEMSNGERALPGETYQVVTKNKKTGRVVGRTTKTVPNDPPQKEYEPPSLTLTIILTALSGSLFASAFLVYLFLRLRRRVKPA